MKLRRIWKIGAITVALGMIGLVAAACGSSQAAVPTPKVAQVLIVDANTVIGAAGVKNPQDICVGSSRFPRGGDVVWQIKVYDPATGKPMDDQSLDSVVVGLKDGQTFKAQYGPHPGAPPGQPQPPPTDYFWTAAWVISNSYPTGSVHLDCTPMIGQKRLGESGGILR